MSDYKYLDRYNRNILIPQISEEGQIKLLASRVLIAGAGGLGSTVIANLASVGIGNIGIIDNDILELTNLNRQYIHKLENIGKSKVNSAKDWIKSYNPEINVETYNLRLDETNAKEIIQNYDIVLDCFDSYKSKFLLNKICVENNITLIHGGVTEFYGQVLTIIPQKSACLNCIIPDHDENAYIVKGVISPAVSTIASIQSMEAIKKIIGIGSPLANILLTYNGLTQEFKKVSVNKNDNCPLCSKKTILMDA